MIVYRIRDWPIFYENNRTRDLRTMAWIPIPNKHDGDGYTMLVCRKNGAALLGAWLVILQVASKCNPRGTLMRDASVPHDAHSISRMTRIPAEVIEEALQVCCHECKWLEIMAPQEGAATPQEGAATPQVGDEEQKGREGKGKKGMEGNSPAALNDEQYLESLKGNPAYAGIDVGLEYGKMCAWCDANRKVATRRRFVNWLNRADRPINGHAPKRPDGARTVLLGKELDRVCASLKELDRQSYEPSGLSADDRANRASLTAKRDAIRKELGL